MRHGLLLVLVLSACSSVPPVYEGRKLTQYGEGTHYLEDESRDGVFLYVRSERVSGPSDATDSGMIRCNALFEELAAKIGERRGRIVKLPEKSGRKMAITPEFCTVAGAVELIEALPPQG